MLPILCQQNRDIKNRLLALNVEESLRGIVRLHSNRWKNIHELKTSTGISVLTERVILPPPITASRLLSENTREKSNQGAICKDLSKTITLQLVAMPKYSPFSLAQSRALAIVPHFTAFLSMAGSTYIIQDILRDKTKKKRIYSRIMLGISIFDLIASSMFFLSTWPIPKGSSPTYASGTTFTCTLQGLLMQLELGIPMYNFGLSIYYLLILVYNWPDARLRKIEPYIHVLSISAPIGTALAGLFLKQYNNANLWCWIGSLPGNCEHSAKANEGNGIPCERGDYSWIYRWAFFYVPIWTCIFAITVVMAMVCRHVWREERASRKWRQKHTSSKDKKKDKIQNLSSQVFWQSVMYVLAFYVTWVFPTTLRTQQTLSKPVPYFVILCMVIFLPLQGFWNFLIYVRPRYQRYREENPTAGTWSTLVKAIVQRLPSRKMVVNWSLFMKSDVEKENDTDEVEDDNIQSELVNRISKIKEALAAEATDIDLEDEGSIDFESLGWVEEDADVLDPAYTLVRSRRSVLETKILENSIYVSPANESNGDNEGSHT